VVISFSLVLLLGVVLVVMVRGGSVKWGPAVVAILFGFSLASTGAADPIRDFLDSVSNSIEDLGDAVEEDQ
jgi:ABC-type phosphate transport system auxiliary subunit